jgi:GT2 family glycosyltransferase
VTSVAVAIPHAGDSELLAECLKALDDSSVVSEVVVTFPRSAGRSREIVKHHAACRAVVTPSLVPFAVATNLAARASTAPYVLFLNDDAAPAPGAVERLADFLDRNPDTGAAAPELHNPDGSYQPSLYRELDLRAAVEELCRPLFQLPGARSLARDPRSDFPKNPLSVGWASAAALLVRRSLYERVDGLSEQYEHGIEDAAFARALRELGAAIVAVPNAVFIHRSGASGFRHEDPERIARALSSGVDGWMYYLRHYRPEHVTPVRAVFLVHALSRLVYFGVKGIVTGRFGRAAAYRRHLGHLLRLPSSGS